MVESVDTQPEPVLKTTTKYKRDAHGRFIKTSQAVSVTSVPQANSAKSDPPLFSFQITNPITYIKAWWKRVVGNEGVKVTLQIKPLTAMALTVVISGSAFGLGRLTLPEPIVQYVPMLAAPTPEPTPNPWKETAYSGKLQVSGIKYYLVTSSDEAITLQVPSAINLQKLIGKRIMAVGEYNRELRIMVVSAATDLEILPASPIPIPTIVPTPTPFPTASPSTE